MAAYRVVFTKYASQDLFEIYCYAATEHSIASADKLIQSLKKRLSAPI